MRAIILDIDGTLLDSMAVDNELYFGAVREILGPVRLRDMADYEHVTDSGVLSQIFADNGYAADDSRSASIKSLFLDGLKAHVDRAGSFPTIDGAVQFVERLRVMPDTYLAIATGCWRDSATLKLESAGFDIGGIVLATSDDADTRVGIMQYAMHAASDRVESITYYGDAEWDRRACRELGWEFVAVGPGVDGLDSYDGYEP